MPADRTYNPCYTISSMSSEEPIMAVKSLGKIDATALTSQPYLTEGDLVYIDTTTGRFEQASAENGKLPQFILVSMPGNIGGTDITMGNPAYGHKFVAIRRARITKSDRSTPWVPGTLLTVANTTADYQPNYGNILPVGYAVSGTTYASNYVVGIAISPYEAIIDLAGAYWLSDSGIASATSSGVAVTFNTTFSRTPSVVLITVQNTDQTITASVSNVTKTGMTIKSSANTNVYWYVTK